MKPYLWKKRGQVLIMVTFSLLAMGGMLGLVVDLGWSYFVEKWAQSAADIATLAAVDATFDTAGPGVYVCGSNVDCAPTPISCDSAFGDLVNGCLYAQQNGFTHNGDNGRQFVTIAADITPSPPTAPGINNALYWVTVRSGTQIPQLFSSIFGNTMGIASSRATAVIADLPIPGSFYGTNQEGDPGPWGEGVDLVLIGGQGTGGSGSGGNWIRMPDGKMYLASSAHGDGGTYTSETSGSAFVDAGGIYLMEGGAVQNPSNYSPAPTGLDDPLAFWDPVERVTSIHNQPTAPTQGEAPLQAVIGGTISGDCSNPPTMTSGTYYALNANTGQATGDPIQISGCVNFGTSAFNDFVFVGGLHLSSAQAVMTVRPGRYFVAGSKPGTPVFSVHTGATLTDQTALDGNGNSAPNSDLGEIFVFTDVQHYPGLGDWLPGAIPGGLPTNLQYGQVVIHTGNNASSGLNLHGLNADFTLKQTLPGNLQHFTPIVFYVDQGNSRLDYDDGTFCPEGQEGCLNNDSTPIANDPMVELQAAPNLDLYGTFYVPRGASLSFKGAGNLDSPIQIIAGTTRLQGGAQINFRQLPLGFTLRQTALVE